jgi:hypothetical protein
VNHIKIDANHVVRNIIGIGLSAIGIVGIYSISVDDHLRQLLLVLIVLVEKCVCVFSEWFGN